MLQKLVLEQRWIHLDPSVTDGETEVREGKSPGPSQTLTALSAALPGTLIWEKNGYFTRITVHTPAAGPELDL
jgi:hypothetical protein